MSQFLPAHHEIKNGSKPVIVQHCFGEIGNGGPMGGLKRLIESELTNTYDFALCVQDRPAGGINIPLLFQMARRIRSLRPDLLHVRGLQNEGFHGLVAGRLAGCRRILVSVHGFSGDIIYPLSSFRQKFVSALLEPFTLSNADGIYCVSEYASKRKEIVRYARNNLGYVHNAVQVPILLRNNRIRSEFGFVDDDVVAITVCRMTKEKGIFDLFSALQSLDNRTSNKLKILLVGDGPELPTLKLLSAGLINIQVHILGKRLDVPELLSASDMFIFPSLHENLSNALLEAMSFALPVVATNVGGNPEVVINGETGILIPPSNPSDLAKAINTLFMSETLRMKMGEEGRHRIETCFSMPVLVSNLDRIYRNLLES